MALVSLAEFYAYTGTDASDEPTITPLLAGVEAMLTHDLGRTRAPFADEVAARVERHDGTGSDRLFLHYPIVGATVIASITVDGETVASTDYAYADGGRRVWRLDDQVFGEFGAPDAVVVTYKSAADWPPAAKVAVLRVAAALFNTRGSEEARDERVGPFGTSYIRAAEEDPVWQSVLRSHLALL